MNIGKGGNCYLIGVKSVIIWIWSGGKEGESLNTLLQIQPGVKL